FQDHAEKLAVSSTKSMTGHLLGAAGGVEAVIAVKAIEDGIIPATINYETPDPDCDLDYVPNESRKQEVNAVMSNSLGFGGHNASLIFKKYKQLFRRLTLLIGSAFLLCPNKPLSCFFVYKHRMKTKLIDKRG